MSSEISHGNSRIYLISSGSLFTEALSYVFDKEVCNKTIIIKDGDPVPLEDPSDGYILYLIDCLERDYEKELIALTGKESSRGERVTAALFNLQRRTGIERKAFKKGIRGFFYRTDSLVQILKGVRSLLQGEIWVSRDILVEVALQGRMRTTRSVHEKVAFTHREIEVLALLSVGSSNEEIAEKLFISPNTVKTHLYRVFRKIKVPNRFQAALWAAKNL